MWLEKHFPGCAVWYGGDSLGVEARPFPQSERDLLFDFFCQDQNSYGSGFEKDKEDCTFCEMPLICNTWFGGKGTGWYCPGCGQRLYKHANDAIVRFEDKKEYEEYKQSMING
jgi:hypothetical protein